MHVSNFSNKIFAETSFSFAKGQQAVQYVRTKNVFLLQAQACFMAIYSASYFFRP